MNWIGLSCWSYRSCAYYYSVELRTGIDVRNDLGDDVRAAALRQVAAKPPPGPPDDRLPSPTLVDHQAAC